MFSNALLNFCSATTGAAVVSALKYHIRDKTVLITGATEGIGLETAISLVQASPRRIILVGRSLEKLANVKKQIEDADPNKAWRTANPQRASQQPVWITIHEIDLSSQASIRRKASLISQSAPEIDVLINNAAIMMPPRYSETEDGIESQFGVNHIGHFLLTNLLMDSLVAAPKKCGRVVNVSCYEHRCGSLRLWDLKFENGKEYDAALAYGQSKTANILFTVALAPRLAPLGIKTFSVDPGYVNTRLRAHLTPETQRAIRTKIIETTGGFCHGQVEKTVQQACASILVAAFHPKIPQHLSGSNVEECSIAPRSPFLPSYLYDSQVARPESYATAKDTAESLWKKSEELVGQTFEFPK